MDRLARISYFKKRIIILAYHGFTDKREHPGIENYQGKHLYIGDLERQLEYLSKHYNVISLGRVIRYYTTGLTLPENSVVITIDDGYRSNYKLAFPVFKKFGIPFTIFITTNFIDKKLPLWVDRLEYAINRTRCNNLAISIGLKVHSFRLQNDSQKRYSEQVLRLRLKSLPPDERDRIIADIEYRLGEKLSLDNNEEVPEIYKPLEWDDIKQMSESKIVSIGSHSCTHTALTQHSLKDMEEEALVSKSVISKKLGLAINTFSYPNGNIGDFNHETKEVLKKAGYLCAITEVPGVNNKYTDIFELKRFGMSKRGDLGEFKRILAGISRLPGYIKQSLLRIRT